MMKRTLTIIYILIAANLLAQTSSNLTFANNINKYPKEKIYVHYNNDFLLSGEKLFYKIYCLEENNQFSPFSKIAYVELIDSDNKSVLQQKVSLTNGIGYGDIFIDTKIKSGAYKLVSYTQWMKNGKSLFEKDIVIINPFTTRIKSTENQNPTKLSNNNNTSLFSNLNETYEKREKLALKLNKEIISKLNGEFSISIKLKDNHSSKRSTIRTNGQNPSNKFFLPELRGSLLKGKITTENSAKLSDIKLSLSLSNSKSIPLTAITNDTGEFFFNIEDLNTDVVFINILDNNRSDYKIELMPFDNGNYKFNNFKELQLTQEMVNSIKARSLYSQIENAYYTVKKDSLLVTPTKTPILDKIKKVYLLDDYTRFSTVRETFIEVIEGAGFYKKGDTYQINVTDTDASETLSYLPSLLIIDGRIVTDHTSFRSYNSRNIKSISLVTDKYFYGNAIYQGVVIVDSFKGDYIDSSDSYKKFTVMPVQPKKLYFFQEHNLKNDRIPDFRTQLYWNPSINSIEEELTFFTSDVAGQYEINIQGYNKIGQLINLTNVFTVK